MARASISPTLPFTLPRDQISTPTYSRDLAEATLGLVELKATGLYNIVGDSVFSRTEFAEQLLLLFAKIWKETGLGLRISGVDTNSLKQTAKRPLRVPLDNSKLRTILPHFNFRSLEEAMTHWHSSERGLAIFGNNTQQ